MLLEMTPALLDDLLFGLIAGKKDWEGMLDSTVAVLELTAAATKAWVITTILGAATKWGICHTENAQVVPTTL